MMLYFVEHHGRVIEREELLQALWPGRHVEEGNVARAVSSLRLALKDQEDDGSLIVTVPGRGYRFGEHVVFEPAAFRSNGRADDEACDAEEDPAVATPPGTDASHASRASRLYRMMISAASVAGVICLVFSVMVWQAPGVSTHAPHNAAPARSIAVLPFVNLSHDGKLDFLSDGLAEELRNAVGRIPTLKVAASGSSFSFKGNPSAISDVARALNVRTLLQGSVQQDARSTHVTAQLIDAATGYQLWSQHYDREAEAVLPLERDIAESVAQSLQIVLVGADMADLTLGGTSNRKAFDAYLTGMAALRASRDNASPAAIAAFGQAIRFDQTYALAYARRARALAYRYASTVFPGAASRLDVLTQARSDAVKAVAIAPNLGAGHAALADVIRFSLSGMAQGLTEIERAFQLSPNDTDVLLDYASMEVDFGHFDAGVAAAERAAALDPLTPLTYIHLAGVLTNSRHFDLAIAALDHAKALSAGVVAADYSLYGFVKILVGEPDAARQICAGRRNAYDLACLAVADHALGQRQDAETALAQLHAAIGESGAYTYAHIAAAWGQADEAQRWLETAYRLRDPGLIFMKVDPALEMIHTTPAFHDIEQKVGFPQ